jgi:hypothetical protein
MVTLGFLIYPKLIAACERPGFLIRIAIEASGECENHSGFMNVQR